MRCGILAVDEPAGIRYLDGVVVDVDLDDAARNPVVRSSIVGWMVGLMSFPTAWLMSLSVERAEVQGSAAVLVQDGADELYNS